jgi:hypothetical protein
MAYVEAKAPVGTMTTAVRILTKVRMNTLLSALRRVI